MIEKMQRVYILVHRAALSGTLLEIQNSGVLHLDLRTLTEEELTKDPTGDLQKLIEQLQQQRNLIKKIADYQSFFRKRVDTQQISYTGKIQDLLAHFETLHHNYSETKTQVEKLQKQRDYLLPWGNYSPEFLASINSAGVNIRLLISSPRQKNALSAAGVFFEELAELGNKCYLAVFGDLSLKDFGEEVVLPSEPPAILQEKILSKKSELDLINQDLLQLSRYYQWVGEELQKQKEHYESDEAKSSFIAKGDIMAISGWVPLTKKSFATECLMRLNDIAFIIEEDIGDAKVEDVPIFLKNNRFSRLFEPITKLFSLPNYQEFDLTPFFAPFFAMFFGLCLGDAGYGLVYLLILSVGFFKYPKWRSLITLGIILNVCVIFWGVLTGTLFGLNLFETKIPLLSDLAVLKSDHVFYLALLIGLLQIFFGMILQTINKIINGGIFAGLSTIGWIILLFSITVLYLSGQKPSGDFYLGLRVIDFCKSFPADVAKIGSIAGVLLILFFNDLRANVFLRIGKGIWELYGITGILGDLLSYIRLFALGVSSGILGAVINSIALRILDIPIPVLSHMIFIVFLIFGHAGNMLISALGSFVHPLRLTFVEFYKNAGYSGGGKPYKPLQRYVET